MRWRAPRLTMLLVVSLAGACVAPEPRQEGGFPDDPRPTFQKHDPYEAISKVRWRAWSEDALSSRRPVLLDLSGKWCHWCHVYDRVIYSQDDFATFINDNYTPVRVDPDRRPDIDARYNQGGWPSLAVLTKAGTVVNGHRFSPTGVSEFLRTTLERVEAGGDSLLDAHRTALEEVARAQPFLRENGTLEADVLGKVMNGVRSHLDFDYGGFRPPGGGTAKLTMPDIHRVLLLQVADEGVDDGVRPFVRKTLDAMINGAVHDHLLGGFFRSVEDRAWSLPHFEKVLEIQAQMIELYLLAADVFDEPAYRDVARGTIDFVTEFMQNPDGVTFSNAIDADRGPDDEGGFYTWSISQIDSLLSPDEARVVKRYYGVAPSGEVPGLGDQNTLFVLGDPEAVAKRLEMDLPAFRATLDRARTRLRAARLASGPPRVDSNAYAGPNLAMASALLAAAGALDEADYREAALGTIDFFTVDLFRELDGIQHVFDGVAASGPAFLSDQVAALESCLRAHAVTGEGEYLERAQRILAILDASYRNEITGAYWDLPATAKPIGLLALKQRPIAENVRIANVLMDLYQLTGRDEHRRAAESVLQAFSVSFGGRGLEAVRYAGAVHRLIWKLRSKSS